MGTRALVRVFEGDIEILCIYRQCDGYPEGLGREVAEFCESKRLVNGIRSSFNEHAIANGAGCLAAQLVVALKDRVGGVYVCPPGSADCGEDYEYRVKCLPVVDNDSAPVYPVVEAYDVICAGGGEARTVTRVQIPSRTKVA